MALVVLLAATVGVFTFGVLGAPEPSTVAPIALDGNDDASDQPSEAPTSSQSGAGALPIPGASPAPAGDDDDDNDDGTRSGSDNTDPA